MCNYLTRGMELALVLIATKCCGLQKVYIDFKRWNMLMAGRAIVCWTTMVWMLRLKPLTIRRMYTFCKNLLLAIDTYRASAWPRRAVFILTELFCFSFSEVSVREQWLQAQSGPLGFCLFSPCFFLAFIQRRTSHHNSPQPIQDEFNSKYSAPKTHPCHFHQRRHASSDRSISISLEASEARQVLSMPGMPAHTRQYMGGYKSSPFRDRQSSWPIGCMGH